MGTSRDALVSIGSRLQNARDGLAKLGRSSRVATATYRDGSVDGELLIKVPRGVSTSDLTYEIEEALGRSPLPGVWTSHGVRYSLDADEKLYRRYRGMNDVSTHPRQASRHNLVDSSLILRQIMIPGLAKRHGRKAEYLYVRLRWTPDGRKPE